MTKLSAEELARRCNMAEEAGAAAFAAGDDAQGRAEVRATLYEGIDDIEDHDAIGAAWTKGWVNAPMTFSDGEVFSPQDEAEVEREAALAAIEGRARAFGRLVVHGDSISLYRAEPDA